MSFTDDYDFDFDADGNLHNCKRKSNPADDFAVPIDQCRYTKGKVDGWGTDWTTGCGRTVRCETPIDVGPQFPPLPNSDGKFCHYCGKLIVLFPN